MAPTPIFLPPIFMKYGLQKADPNMATNSMKCMWIVLKQDIFSYLAFHLTLEMWTTKKDDEEGFFDPVAPVWVCMRSGRPTWARPRHPLPNIQIFGYERGIHLIKGKSQRNWSKNSIHAQMDTRYNSERHGGHTATTQKHGIQDTMLCSLDLKSLSF